MFIDSISIAIVSPAVKLIFHLELGTGFRPSYFHLGCIGRRRHVTDGDTFSILSFSCLFSLIWQTTRKDYFLQ